LVKGEIQKQEEKMGEDKIDAGRTVEKNKQKEDQKMGAGIFISKKTLWLVAGGALGALAAIGLAKGAKKIRPALVGVAKESYAFKEWATGKMETAREDIEDIVAEAKHAYYQDVEATAAAVKREKEILEKVEEEIRKKTPVTSLKKEDQ
jgi:hypothetical protein